MNRPSPRVMRRIAAVTTPLAPFLGLLGAVEHQPVLVALAAVSFVSGLIALACGRRS
jgi:hypothetical protein